MANKFQKSIMERLEQDSLRQRQVEKAEKKKTTVPAEKNAPAATAAIKESTEKIPPVVMETEISLERDLPRKESVKRSSTLDLSEYVIQDSRRKAKNKTFYLDEEVIDALRSAARQQNVNDSKLVNDILRKVLRVSG